MVKINKIRLSNYRNFLNLEILFKKKVNIFYGDNGSGKTNILESISLLGKGRGIRNTQLLNLINKDKSNFFIEACLEINNDDFDIKISSECNNNKVKKTISVNDDLSPDTLKYLNSSLSFLIFLPEMERLFQSNPTNRRNFIDRLIFTEKHNYNRIINKYKKNILERNKILQQNNYDLNWINTIENEISNIGIEIYKLRNTKLFILNEQIKILNQSNKYNFEIDLKIKDDFYNENLSHETYMSSLYKYRDYDKKFGGSKIGPHKSDILAIINNDIDSSLLSTGQQKTIVLILLLAQCNYLVNIKKIRPIVLLDEICSHLDTSNRKILLDMIKNFDIQFFLTGTEKTLFSFISTNAEFYNISN